MRENNVAASPRGWERMSVAELDELLHRELQKTAPDEKTVTGLLETIRRLEPGEPDTVHVQILKAWEQYKANVTKAAKPPKKRWSVWLVRCAAIIGVICILVAAVPQSVEADSFFGKVVRWAERVFETVTPFSTPAEYVFQTEHPGLQALYDTVTAAGVTQKTVPQWIPKELRIEEIKVTEAPFKTRIQTRFVAEGIWIACSFDIYDTEKNSGYAKDTSKKEILEVNGIAHDIFSNDNDWSAVWTVDNVECTVATNCGRETLIKIISSIYDAEVYE